MSPTEIMVMKDEEEKVSVESVAKKTMDGRMWDKDRRMALALSADWGAKMTNIQIFISALNALWQSCKDEDEKLKGP